MVTTAWKPSQAPPTKDPTAIIHWLTGELNNLAQVLNRYDRLQFIPLTVAPPKPSEGLVVFADGVEWDPGSGAGLYQYVGGSWIAL